MIIFNIHAILVALLALLFSIPFFIAAYFNWIGQHMTMIFVSWMLLLAALVGKFKLDIVGRLFFLPMWIICIPIPFIFTSAFYGWTGIILTLSIILSPLALIIGLLYKNEKERADNIRNENVNLPSLENDRVEFWTAVEKTLFVPTFIKMRSEIAGFNIRVVDEVIKQGFDSSSLQTYKGEMLKVQNNSSKINKTLTRLFDAELSLLLDEDGEEYQKEVMDKNDTEESQENKEGRLALE